MSKYKVVNSPRSQVTQGELLERDGSAYILPPASESEMGGVRVGQRLYMVGNILNAVDQRYDDTALALAVADNAADIQDLADALMPDLSGYATDAELTAGDVATLAAAKDYADEQVPDLSGYATLAGAVPKSLIDAKGDLLVGTANDTLSRLPVGPNGSLLMADSNSATGLSYQSPAPLLVNMLSNSDFSNGTTGWFGTGGPLTNEGNTLILTAADAVTRGYVTNNTTILAGHQYYVSVRFTPFRTHNLLISLGDEYLNTPNSAAAGIATQVSATITALQARGFVGFYSNNAVTTGQTTGARVGFDNAVCIDLTTAFGAGFEPSKDEMDKLMAQWGGWFADTDPKLLPSYAWAKRTQGAAVNVINDPLFLSGTTNWMAYYGTYAAAYRVATATGDGTGAAVSIRQNTGVSTATGSKIYVRAGQRNGGNATSLYHGFISGATFYATTAVSAPVNGTWYTTSAILTAADASAPITLRSYAIYPDAATANGQASSLRYPLVIDLTAAFGAGNEPTKSEMDLLLSKYPNSWFNGTVNDLVKDFDKWNRRGTGSPEGVVTAAPGVKWTDTANTNGAREWRKDTGTGNTGWVVTVGDTADRVLGNANLSNGWTTGVGETRLRRVNNVVFLTSGSNGVNPASKTGPQFINLPVGFRPADIPNYAAIGSGFEAGSETPRKIVKSFGSLQCSAAAVTITFVISWATADVWPSTLPGTPA